MAHTIAAIATPIGQGGVGIVRLSGDKAYDIGCALTHRQALTPRHAHFARVYDGTGAVLDEVVLLYFKAPHSFTGEDVVEIQGHGGVVLMNLLLSRCFELGARQATAGEFSYRAFDNDKLDLLQAEAISDAISATSIAEARSAVRSLSGEFSHKIHALNEEIINIRLYVEASIDFSDEEDVTFLSDGVIAERLDTVMTHIDDSLKTAKTGALLKNGVQVVLAGKPNAGKSSLLNTLAGIERAIVTDVAGTTRDTLQETVILRGLSVYLTDTAGLRQTQDKVEQIGIERAKSAISDADVLMLVYDLSVEHDPVALAKSLFGELMTEEDLLNKNLLLIGNKADKVNGEQYPIGKVNHGALVGVNVSCETKAGMETLIDVLCEMVGFYPNDSSVIARTRHVDALRRVLNHCQEAKVQLNDYQAGELVAESLRLAQKELGELTGEFSSDALLGRIFSSFCIGK